MASVGCALTFAGSGPATAHANPKVNHVLLLSLDGFHDFDLTNYVAAHPASALAQVVARGRRYSNASAQAPSDSFPGTLAMTTGGSPRSTGVYYDVSWDNNLSPAGSDCSTRGALVPFNQTINFNANAGDSVADINPAKLPRDPDNGCTVVYPHQFLKVNTIYEVAHAAGLRTAVADKHPSYEILAGPSGTGLDDFYGPEFNAAKADITKIMANDELKVGAVLNEIDGLNHQGTATVGVPAIFGMNFQAPNIAQKFSGYVDAAGTTRRTSPRWARSRGIAPGLAQALDYVDGAIGRMLEPPRRQRADRRHDGDPDREARQQPGRPRDAAMGRPGAVHPAHQQRAARPDRAGDRGHHGAHLAQGPQPSRRRRGRAAGERGRDRSAARSRVARRSRRSSAASWPGTRPASPTSSCNRTPGVVYAAPTPSSSTTGAAAPRTPTSRWSSSTLRHDGGVTLELPGVTAPGRPDHPEGARSQAEARSTPSGSRAPSACRTTTTATDPEEVAE